MKKLILASVLALSLIAAPQAEAHFLKKSKAERIAWRVTRDVCNATYDCDSYWAGSPSRVSAHKVEVQIQYWTLDGLSCYDTIRVYYRSYWSRRTSISFPYGIDCEDDNAFPDWLR